MDGKLREGNLSHSLTTVPCVLKLEVHLVCGRKAWTDSGSLSLIEIVAFKDARSLEINYFGFGFEFCYLLTSSDSVSLCLKSAL